MTRKKSKAKKTPQIPAGSASDDSSPKAPERPSQTSTGEPRQSSTENPSQALAVDISREPEQSSSVRSGEQSPEKPPQKATEKSTWKEPTAPPAKSSQRSAQMSWPLPNEAIPKPIDMPVTDWVYSDHSEVHVTNNSAWFEKEPTAIVSYLHGEVNDMPDYNITSHIQAVGNVKLPVLIHGGPQGVKTLRLQEVVYIAHQPYNVIAGQALQRQGMHHKVLDGCDGQLWDIDKKETIALRNPRNEAWTLLLPEPPRGLLPLNPIFSPGLGSQYYCNHWLEEERQRYRRIRDGELQEDNEKHLTPMEAEALKRPQAVNSIAVPLSPAQIETLRSRTISHRYKMPIELWPPANICKVMGKFQLSAPYAEFLALGWRTPGAFVSALGLSKQSPRDRRRAYRLLLRSFETVILPCEYRGPVPRNGISIPAEERYTWMRKHYGSMKEFMRAHDMSDKSNDAGSKALMFAGMTMLHEAQEDQAQQKRQTSAALEAPESLAQSDGRPFVGDPGGYRLPAGANDSNMEHAPRRANMFEAAAAAHALRNQGQTESAVLLSPAATQPAPSANREMPIYFHHLPLRPARSLVPPSRGEDNMQVIAARQAQRQATVEDEPQMEDESENDLYSAD